MKIKRKLELYIAWRYLTARRKQTLIPVISWISILGIAAGVMAMIIALALSTGFREEIQSRILFATSHINIMRIDGTAMVSYDALLERLQAIPGVVQVSPVIYDQVFLTFGNRSQGAVLKGIDPQREAKGGDLSRQLVSGEISSLSSSQDVEKNGWAGIFLGKELADQLGVKMGGLVKAYTAKGKLSPLGMAPGIRGFQVVGIFSSGLWDYDRNWAYVSLPSAQKLFALPAASAAVLELKVADIYKVEGLAEEILRSLGAGFTATNWIEQNRPLFSAMKLEKLAMFITVCLIVMVAALNIVTTLIMMVMEKNRDIGILNAMGATEQNILHIFMLQGIILGIAGTFIGIFGGIGASYVLDHYRLIHLEPEVYAIPYVPFHVLSSDVLLVAFSAILISLLATFYPARTAARLNPVEALRHD